MEHIKVYKWYSNDRVKLVFEGNYNGPWFDMMDYIKENIPVRKVGRFIVYVELERGRKALFVFNEAEFEFPKAHFILWDSEIDVICKIACGEK